ncbi:hypothetical protein [Vibrio cyclitrophicus]|uniref:Uncharacterized protein n=1 Tax=Vibrio cyclitrophicus TaxID=47951 RepID=A0ACD5G7L2_9VIBR
MDLEEIKQGLSTEKLETYRQVLDCKSDSELIAVYMAMQSIMSQFFSVVQLLEVTLRNSIHKSATECFEDDEWYKRIPLSQESRKQVDFAEQQCLKDVGARYTSNDSCFSITVWILGSHVTPRLQQPSQQRIITYGKHSWISVSRTLERRELNSIHYFRKWEH